MSPTPAHIEIQAPVEVVFAWLDESEKALQWIGGLEQITPITEGGNRVGARAKHVYVEGGRRIEMIEETLVYEPNRRVKIRGESDAFTMTAEYTLTARGDSTVLELTSDSRFTSGAMRMLAPLFAGSSNRRVMKDLRKLKELVESA
ncbi:MAG: SRPBCC family protein [Rhodoglobus sp.]